MKKRRIDRKTIKAAIAITLCCLLHILFSVIAYFKKQDQYIYLYIPIISSLTAFFCVVKKDKNYVKRTFLKLSYYLIIVTFAFIMVVLYKLIARTEWPFMVLTEPLHLIIPTLYICLGSVLLSYITILLKSKKYLPQFMILYIIFLSIDFYDLNIYYLYASYLISISIGGLIALLVNTFPIKFYRNKNISFIYCLDGLNKKIYDKLDDYEKELLEELINDDCSISFYSKSSLPITYNKISNLHFKEPVLCNHGAILYDYNNKVCLYNETIDYRISKDLDKFFIEHNISAFKSFIYDNLYYVFNEFPTNICELKYKEVMKNQVHCQYLGFDEPNVPLTCYQIFDTKENILEIETLLKTTSFYDGIYVTISKVKDLLDVDGYYVLTILSKNVIKLKALNVLKQDKKIYSISYSKADALLYYKSDYVITNKKANKEVLDKTNYIINSKRDHSLVRIIKKLYYKKASY